MGLPAIKAAARILGVAALLCALIPGCRDGAPPIPPKQDAGAASVPATSPGLGEASPLAASAGPLMPANAPPALWRSLSRRLGLVIIRGPFGGDTLLGYDAATARFVRISDEMPALLVAAIVDGPAPVVVYVRAPRTGIVVGRIVLATGERHEIELGHADRVELGASRIEPDGDEALMIWIASRTGSRERLAVAQWSERKLVTPPAATRATLAGASPLWVIAGGAPDVVATMQRGGGAVADVEVDWDQWGTASALRLPKLARVLPMQRFADARGMAWSPDKRWLLLAQWSHEICEAHAVATLALFDTLTETTLDVGPLAPSGRYGWLGNNVFIMESDGGGRLLQLGTGLDINGNVPSPRELGQWRDLRWPIRWRAADCGGETLGSLQAPDWLVITSC
ncbi:MAG: hypothetical protein IPL79_07200 [Myxococcales bacterium]|nr:hypothetical protein [Myxococcales bacterium]